MVRILQVNKFYAPWIGGIEKVAQDIAEGVQDFPDVHCEVLVCNHRGPSTISDLNGVRVSRVASLGTALSMPMSLSFPSRLAAIAPQFDIIHVHAPFPLAFFCDWKAIKAKGPRLVIHYHSDIVRKLQRAVMFGLTRFERQFMEAADRIFVTSEGLLDNSSTLVPFREKCRVVTPFVDIGRVEQLTAHEISSARFRYGLADNDKVVLFTGRLVLYKGVNFLIDAASNLEAHVLIVGDGPLRPMLQKKIETLGMQSRVRLHGRVSDAELSSLYSLADLFVLPSISPTEAFGVVQLEAMAHGVPVVNTNLPSGVPSVSVHGVTGLTVPPGDAGALRDAIIAILSNDALRDEFSKNAQERVHLFSRSVVLDKMLCLYKELLPEHVLAR
jgi:rhamnosyl/mannosyltransferase